MAELVIIGLRTLVPDGKLTEIEVFELLCDYISSPSFQEHYDSEDYEADPGGWSLFTAGQDIEALWTLIPKLPEWMSYPLLELLLAQG